MISKLLWPEICPFCGKVYYKGICPACKIKIEKLRIHHPRCMKCGKPVRSQEQEYCYDCVNTKHYFDRGRALWLHKPPVSYSIYQFKYHNQQVFGKYYMDEICNHLKTFILECNPQLIIPIPLHKKRKRKRGYNQAEILAKELGERLLVPVAYNVLKRTRYTNPQKNLDHATRKKNLQKAFIVTKKLAGIKRVMLVDDIYTTGNTVDEAAKRLKEAGVEKVYFLSVSIGQGF